MAWRCTAGVDWDPRRIEAHAGGFELPIDHSQAQRFLPVIGGHIDEKRAQRIDAAERRGDRRGHPHAAIEQRQDRPHLVVCEGDRWRPRRHPSAVP
jgi:hypothetical protein